MSSNLNFKKGVLSVLILIIILILYSKISFIPIVNNEAKNIEKKRELEYKKPKIVKSVLIKDIPHVLQKPDYCGEACVEMYLSKLGSKLTQDDVFEKSHLDPKLGRGCYTPELVTALKNLKFNIGPVWYIVEAKNSEVELEKLWWDIYGNLAVGIPSIVCMHYDDQPETTEHFRLILGYDKDKDEVIYNEPAEENGGYWRMSKKMFLKLWPLKYKKDRWLIVRMTLDK